jgi:hypothetical protein
MAKDTGSSVHALLRTPSLNDQVLNILNCSKDSGRLKSHPPPALTCAMDDQPDLYRPLSKLILKPLIAATLGLSFLASSRGSPTSNTSSGRKSQLPPLLLPDAAAFAPVPKMQPSQTCRYLPPLHTCNPRLSPRLCITLHEKQSLLSPADAAAAAAA